MSMKRGQYVNFFAPMSSKTNMPLYEQVELLMVFLTSLNCLQLIMIISNVYLI
ncbi:hypothetical protein OIU79_030815 [Salix purpurea]|uniref:Uncharacterized protein n=1 Tax=Salix purpurea TaxID=77065 RepID=A0A9Q0VBG9_SALPP|nr:hypothetical protein OIU79_030815 [Salix purpurea]